MVYIPWDFNKHAKLSGAGLLLEMAPVMKVCVCGGGAGEKGRPAAGDGPSHEGVCVWGVGGRAGGGVLGGEGGHRTLLVPTDRWGACVWGVFVCVCVGGGRAGGGGGGGSDQALYTSTYTCLGSCAGPLFTPMMVVLPGPRLGPGSQP